MDKEEKLIDIDIDIDGEDNRAIRYNYDSLEVPNSNNDDSFEDYMINACKRV